MQNELVICSWIYISFGAMIMMIYLEEMRILYVLVKISVYMSL